MGGKLAAYFDTAAQLGGIEAKIKLAMLTKLSREKAEEAQDSPQNIEKFEEVMVELVAQYTN